MAKTKQNKNTAVSKTTDSPGGIGRRLLWILGGVVIFGGAVLIALDVTEPLPPPPPELEAVQTLPVMDPAHLPPGSPLPVYNSDPPTSGPMDSVPAQCGIYRQPVSDQAYLHSLEHGAVVIQYNPSASQSEVEELERIARSIRGEIILAPRPDNPSLVSLVAWTNLLLIDEINEDVIRGFDREFANRNAPEPGAICPFQVDQGA
jgi:Protein of unknown function (DUF3105)